MRLAALSVVFSTSVTVAVSCQQSARHGVDDGATSGAKLDAGTGFEVGGDGAVFCGSEQHKVVAKPPLLYFVMDTSGSMAADAGGGKTRYDVLHDASVDLVSSLGGLIRVGAAVFPYKATEQSPCANGKEVMPATHGGSSAATTFANATKVDPNGGTPTASTLAALVPKFANAASDPDGPEAILLVTDGGPNCNFDLSCDASECMINIEGECPDDVDNCCDPDSGGTPANCIDHAGVLQAIHDVVAGGAHVYVIGIAVDEAYANTLAQMALVGGAPQQGAPFYYPVDDINEIETTFRGIAQALISCQLKLDSPPSDPDLTNVYFDGAVVLQDPENGWVWNDAKDEVDLVGDACTKLKSGSVTSVQVLTGCPTQTPQ